jgi:phage repressor protein C with HTH and peptisase S24 domain
MSHDTLSQRVLAILHEFGITQKELAAVAGVKPPSVTNWIGGRTKEIKAEPAIAIANRFGVNADWLVSGSGKMHTSDCEPSGLASIAAGPFIFAGERWQAIPVENATDAPPVLVYAKFLEQFGYEAQALRAGKMTGRCMEPTLFDGDLIVFNTGEREPRDGQAFVVAFEGEPTDSQHVRRFRRQSGTWQMFADNPDQIRFAPRPFAPPADAIIGRVIFKQSLVI